MFSSSVRKVASSTPQIPITSTLSSAAQRSTASRALSYRCHQRRQSSSKPSSPANGPKGVADGQVPAGHAQARPDGEKKSSKRKAKDTIAGTGAKGRDEAMHNLPSVPSTQHISPNQIAASQFFSLHRPISLTVNFPKRVTDDAFAAIFTPRTKSNIKPAEVISTLSSTVQDIESVTGQLKQLNLGNNQQAQWNAETDEPRASITAESYRKAEAEAQHLDSPPLEAAMEFPRHILSGTYQPFNPPPAPLPMDTAESLAAGAEAAASQDPHQRTYTSILTIQESTDVHGEVTYVAHSSPLREGPKRFSDRMQIRQERFLERTEGNGMLAISVKRQRKLKMKKHKYKKLMRRTRNLRRRLDRN